jgi:hypothetical protein
MSVATLTLSLSAAAIATTATGGLAAQGDLPGPIQRVVAQAASGVGITLPSGDSSAGSSGSVNSKGGPPAASAGSKSKTTATPSASSASARGSHDGSPLPGGIGPRATPKTGDGRGGRGTDDGSAESPSGATASATHDNCIAYAEQIAGTLGLGDSGRSTFVSLVDHDQAAVTVRVTEGASPDAACQSSIDRARASVAGGGSPGGGDDHPTPGPGHGKDASPSPTPTPTPTATPGSDGGSGRKGAPTPSPTPSPSGSVHGGKT